MPSLSQKKKRKSRKRSYAWPRLLLFIASLVALCGFLFSFYRSNMTFHTTEYTISSPYLPNAFNRYRIAQISDLHNNVFGNKGEALQKAVDAAAPNIVVITGDTISRRSNDTHAVVEALKPIAAKYPTYFIRGNHELYRDAHRDDAADFYKALDAAGVIRLENRSVSLMHREATIQLAGLMEPLSCYENRTAPDVEQWLGKKKNEYTILLAHNPLPFAAYAKWGAELTLAGHVHGGVVRLPFIGGLFSPERRLFPAYSKGIYRQGKSAMVVSAGMGGSMFPFRLFNPQELVVITLQSQSIH